MDGVDIAYCEFDMPDETLNKKTKIHFAIKIAETIPYPERWMTRLTHLNEQPIFLYPKTDAYYGKYLGQLVTDFIKKNNLTVDLISSHGHTIFHQPENGFTAQIGDGAAIQAETNLPVVCNFRTVDVALGGQGAPLVPVGDHGLFSEYDTCLNLGGFANISFTENDLLKAFDICPCNTILNHVAAWKNLPFDDKGKIAENGKVNTDLLTELNELEFYKKHDAKSLGKEWVNEKFWPVVKKFDSLNDEDLMATFAEHISIQISIVIHSANAKNILLTGGGALNDFLIHLITKKTSSKMIIPELNIINYKEALIFAYLGVLRVRNEINVMSSVTGAIKNSIGGALYGNFFPHKAS